jgi:hypothetical protein
MKLVVAPEAAAQILTRRVLTGVLAFVALVGAACGGSNGQSCAQGTERCPCYGNGTCNSGLTCASNTCVNLGGAGGASGSGGQGGTTGSGGSSRGGTAGTSTPGTGGTATGGSGGASTGGSGGSCAADTSSDPMNCGACGHVCKNADPVFRPYCPDTGCCASGLCGPSFSPCLTQAQATTCAAYCSSIGETCVQGGCALGGNTWIGWGSANACAVFHDPPEASSGRACTENIGFDAAAVQIRCCCTDTH